MANEPHIEITGYASNVKHWQNERITFSVAVTPSYKNQQGQWVNQPTMFFNVSCTRNETKKTAQQIEQLLNSGNAVRVLVTGAFTESENKQGGAAFKNVMPDRIGIVEYHPKRNSSAPNGGGQPMFQQPQSAGGQAYDPWSPQGV
ncbi:hypothetical protein GCM10007377_16050 [Galliscardovia ingluviei]|uniref:Uncharacterized protein n=1 Tax=Galliscardovia ingluviei TaxID=1769422 RepID=A0A8J3ASP4_9BIFI|nr:single-stranded DNA-binding protein [Galliscardovia ingluviei]GGI15468.1 hypothetical protein GCM10007377_16050 [Galliscardovia ingluviei]